MSKYTIKPNVRNGRPVVYYNHAGEIRPIALVDDQCSYQLVSDKDIVVSRNNGPFIHQMEFYKLSEDKYSTIPFGHPMLNKVIVSFAVDDWLKSDNFYVNNCFPGYKVPDIVSVLTRFNVDSFLEEIAFETNYGAHAWNMKVEPKLFNIDFSCVDYSMSRYYQDLEFVQGDEKIDKVFKGMPDEYINYIKDRNVINGGFYHIDEEECDWRRAMTLPDITSVCCIWNDRDEPVRYNDIIFIKDDGSIELFSIYNFISTIKMIEHNFACFPFEVPSNVRRMIHVTHGCTDKKGIASDTLVRWQLFRKK